jgi:hypothetical protein
MKSMIAVALAATVSAGCASLTPGGKNVRVYQADVAAADAPAPPLPDGCRLLKTWGPIDQEQQAREISDPYLQERNETAAAGGNILYLRSYRFMNLMKTDCPVGDKSPGCMDQSQSWYKVTFHSYACDAGALAELAAAPNPPNVAIFRWEYKKKAPAPAPEPPASAGVPAPSAPPAPRPAAATAANAAAAAELKAKILALQQEGVGTDVIVSYVGANRPRAPLTADEIIDWKKAGISDAVIRATFPN